MKKRVKLDVATNRQAAAAFTGSMVAWCDHPDVQVTCSPHDDDVSVQDVLVKHRVGEAPGQTTFHIVTYADNHRAQVIERWVLEVTACIRIDIKVPPRLPPSPSPRDPCLAGCRGSRLIRLLRPARACRRG
jgi:hypothetical protein